SVSMARILAVRNSLRLSQQPWVAMPESLPSGPAWRYPHADAGAEDSLASQVKDFNAHGQFITISRFACRCVQGGDRAHATFGLLQIFHIHATRDPAHR